MIWNNCYLPPDPFQWQGRSDTPALSCFFQIVKMLNLLEVEPPEDEQTTFAFIGFRCDEGIRRNHGRTGAAEGPSAIRHALGRLSIQKQNFQCFDAGNIICIEGDLEAAQAALGDVVALLLKKNIYPIVLGGGQELAWGHYQGIAKTFSDKHLGIINFDAHLDMRSTLSGDRGTSGTAFLQIAEAHQLTKARFDYNCVGIQQAANTHQLVEIAKQHNTNVILADLLHQGQLENCVDFIDRVIDQNEIIYVSIDLGVFSSAFAPGVSSTQSLGLFPWHVIPLLRQIAASGKIISYDIAELSPRYDIDLCTAKLAANLIFEFIHHHNEQPRPW